MPQHFAYGSNMDAKQMATRCPGGETEWELNARGAIPGSTPGSGVKPPTSAPLATEPTPTELPSISRSGVRPRALLNRLPLGSRARNIRTLNYVSEEVHDVPDYVSRVRPFGLRPC